MGEEEQQHLVLSNVKREMSNCFMTSLTKWVLQFGMWVAFIAWIAVFFLAPSDYGSQLYGQWVAATSASIFGETGSALLLYNGPLLSIACLAVPYLALNKRTAMAYKRFDGVQLLRQTAYCFGLIALSCLAFLFLPVARGSILLRLVGINFEHATRYHIWLGHVTMFLLTLHGLGYMTVWTIGGTLLSSIIEWKSTTGANFAGVISYSFGLLIWTTTLPSVRKRFFEVFYYTHQLYVLFVIFFALHVGDTVFSKAVGGLFLFMLDRFLRFCQSRQNVSIISATNFPCGTVKLVISKPENLQPNALGLVFLKVREISWFQWHPFSVSSGLLDSKRHLSVHIKAVGGWTSRLKEMISNSVMAPDPCSTITASVEGPYGLEIPYYMRYKSLILVGGGSGISPLLAIVSDILHHIKEGRPCVPRHVLLVWAVKKSDELYLLSILDIDQPSSDELNVEIQAYVTHESDLFLEQGRVQMVTKTSFISSSKRHDMSGLVGTANSLWPGTYVAVCSVGFVISLGLLDMCYINPFSITWKWYKGLLLVICMLISIFIFGGLVIGVWYLWEKTSTVDGREEDMKNMDLMRHDDPVVTEELCQETMARSAIYYSGRPDFREIFGCISDCWGQTDICVIVCGPPSLQSSVARECRCKNLTRRRDQPIFHFNSHSFNF